MIAGRLGHPRWFAAVAVLAACAMVAPRAASGAIPPSEPSVDGSAALAAVRASLAAPCLVLYVTLSRADSNDIVLASVGTYDRVAAVGEFWSLLRDDDGRGALLFQATYTDGLVQLSPILDLANGAIRAGFAGSPQELVEGASPGGPTFGRLGRYQPTSAIDLLAGIDPSSVEQVGMTNPTRIDVVVDLDAAVASAPDRPGLQAAVSAIAVRRLHARLELLGPSDVALRVDYMIDVPSGAGEPAHGATWSALVAPLQRGGC